MANMLFSELIKEKQKSSNDIRKKYGFSSQNKLVWIVKISDDNINNNLINWLKVLPSDFVVLSKIKCKNEKNIAFTQKELDLEVWYDFIICDDYSNFNLDFNLKNWIVPILNKWNHLWALFREFNPFINEWNSFLYSEKNEWSIFYSLIRCLENMKFPQDRKNLVKNVFEMQ